MLLKTSFGACPGLSRVALLGRAYTFPLPSLCQGASGKHEPTDSWQSSSNTNMKESEVERRFLGGSSRVKSGRARIRLTTNDYPLCPWLDSVPQPYRTMHPHQREDWSWNTRAKRRGRKELCSRLASHPQYWTLSFPENEASMQVEYAGFCEPQ